jgi:putative DNA primase/helicase
MSLVDTRLPSHYILKDKSEDKLIKERDSFEHDSLEYKVTAQKLNRRMMKNRGIRREKDKLELDSDKFGKYVYNNRIHAKLIHQQVYFYNVLKGTYDQVSERFVLKCMKEILEECPYKVWSMSRQSVYLESFMLCLEHITELTPDPNSLLLNNGILYIDDYCNGKQTLAPFTPDEIHLTRVANNYDPTASCEIFEHTLNDIFNHDKQTVLAFQEIMGWLLYYGGHWKIQKFIVFYGSGSNGKSLLCSVIRRLLGEDNCSSSFLDSIQERFGFQDMFGKMVNISPESEQKKALNSASIKAFTGGDAITYEFKHRPAFTSYNYTKLIIATNSKIKTNDRSMGFFRRLLIFVFENTYKELKAGEQRKPNIKYMDTELEAKLMMELPGILNFALQGLKRLIDNNWRLTESTKMRSLQEQYYREVNELEIFADQCLLYIENGKTKSSDLYTQYEKWCKDVLNRDVSYNRQNFHKAFKEYLSSEGVIWRLVELRGYQHYKGIALAEASQNIV